MAVSKQKQEDLTSRMEKLNIRETDLIEKFILGSGPGGQKVNKTASGVYLKHLPTGIEIKCFKDRSQDINRFLARRSLCECLEKELLGKKSSHEKKIEKIKKQKKRRNRKNKIKLLENLPNNL